MAETGIFLVISQFLKIQITLEYNNRIQLPSTIGLYSKVQYAIQKKKIAYQWRR